MGWGKLADLADEYGINSDETKVQISRMCGTRWTTTRKNLKLMPSTTVVTWITPTAGVLRLKINFLKDFL